MKFCHPKLQSPKNNSVKKEAKRREIGFSDPDLGVRNFYLCSSNLKNPQLIVNQISTLQLFF